MLVLETQVSNTSGRSLRSRKGCWTSLVSDLLCQIQNTTLIVDALSLHFHTNWTDKGSNTSCDYCHLSKTQSIFCKDGKAFRAWKLLRILDRGPPRLVQLCSKLGWPLSPHPNIYLHVHTQNLSSFLKYPSSPATIRALRFSFPNRKRLRRFQVDKISEIYIPPSTSHNIFHLSWMQRRRFGSSTAQTGENSFRIIDPCSPNSTNQEKIIPYSERIESILK